MTVEVRYLGHLGNNLFQYALGRIVAEHLDRELITVPAEDMPGWSNVERTSGIVDRLQDHISAFPELTTPLPGTQIDKPQLRYVVGERRWNGHAINLPHLLTHGRDRRIVLKGYFQRTEYYHPHKDRIRNWFRMREYPVDLQPGPRDIVVHIRRSMDMFVLDRAIDVGFYRELLEGLSFEKVYVCGLGIDHQLKQVLAPFGPVYVGLPALPTLSMLARSNRIVLANSTFSWWGAYLSDAEEIYFPRLERGFWSPERPEVDLEVPESRYRVVEDVSVENWRPFRVAAGVRLALHPMADGKLAFVISGERLERSHAQVPEELGPVCEWIASCPDDFGMMDFDELELAPGLQPKILQLLALLSRHGGIEVREGTFEAMSRASP
jgi:hypothetical protein